MDADDRFDIIEEKLDRIFTRLENIEHALGIRPTSGDPLLSESMDELRDRITVVELAAGVKE
jgi:hypothetical protein